MPPTFVFLGPTLPLAEARARLPGATYLPPAAMGDVLAALRHRPRAIAIVDGHFEHTASVWHKEILAALERGVPVLGAASMGALRAAELAPLGMLGVGAVYRAFARAELTDDDEVAVAHGPAEYGWPRFSEAMVNLRDGLARAAAARVIGPRVAARLVALAKARFWRERGWPTLLEDAAAAGLAPRPLAALDAWVRRVRPDRKAADARLLLARLASSRALPRPRLAEPLARTFFFERLVATVAARGSGR